MRPKILLLPSWYPSKIHATNGIFIRRFAEAMSEHVDLKVLYAVSSSSSDKIEFERIQQNGFEEIIVYYPKVKSGLFSSIQKLNSFFKAYFFGFNEIKNEGFKPDLVHVQVAMNAGLFAIELKKQKNIPFIITEHWSGYLPEDGRYKGFIIKNFTHRVFANASSTVTVSKVLGNSLVKHKLIKGFSVIPNSVQTDVFKPNETQKTPEGFIHISNFAKEKQVGKIIASFQKLLESGVNTKLLLVGDGDEKEMLQARCNSNPILKTTVEFLPFQTPEQLNDLINRCYSLVLFSLFETMSIVMAETWACGKPVIVPAVGGIPEYFNSDLGIMIETGNENQLLAAMKSMISNHTDFKPEAIRKHALNKFSIEKICAAYLEIYNEQIR